MIVCHCQRITDTDIRSAIEWMRSSDPDMLITPGRIYRSLGKAADCGGCMPLFVSTMQGSKHLEVPNLQDMTPSLPSKEFIQCKATARSSTI